MSRSITRTQWNRLARWTIQAALLLLLLAVRTVFPSHYHQRLPKHAHRDRERKKRARKREREAIKECLWGQPCKKRTSRSLLHYNTHKYKFNLSHGNKAAHTHTRAHGWADATRRLTPELEASKCSSSLWITTRGRLTETQRDPVSPLLFSAANLYHIICCVSNEGQP